MSFEPKCREVCTEDEYEHLKKAFFEKEKNLSEIHGDFLGDGRWTTQGNIIEMIKVLFICRGSIWRKGQNPSVYAALRAPGQDFYQRFINIRIESFSMRQITEYILVKPGAYLWIHREWGVGVFFASTQTTYESGRPYLAVQFCQKK